MVRKIFKESNLQVSWWNLVFGILSWIPLHSPLFNIVAILMNNIEVGNSALKKLHKDIYDKSVRVVFFYQRREYTMESSWLWDTIIKKWIPVMAGHHVQLL